MADSHSPAGLSIREREALQTALLAVFSGYDLNVFVGLTSSGVMIRSQDSRVDARNLGRVLARLESD